MPIYEFGQNSISRVEETTFSSADRQERRDLQRLIREHVEVLASDILVIAEEFGEWDDSRRRIDLLGIDKVGNIVVIELKRTEDGGHMDLQAIRYAAMVSNMTFDQAVDIFGRYLDTLGRGDEEARTTILDFLGWDEPDDEQFAQDVRIILASAEFSKELTSSVLWLIDHDIDIRCVRLKPYTLESRLLVEVQQIIPLPEASEYQVQVREKNRKERLARTDGPDFTRFDVKIDDESHSSMWKRNAIFAVCKKLCEKGISPDEITALFAWRSNRVWRIVDGKLDSRQFVDTALEKAASGEFNFRPRKWFCDEGELIHFDGKTYAFSNQWGGNRWHKAMNLLKDKYPQFKITFSPS